MLKNISFSVVVVKNSAGERNIAY
jgi:hypothetical protein